MTDSEVTQAKELLLREGRCSFEELHEVFSSFRQEIEVSDKEIAMCLCYVYLDLKKCGSVSYWHNANVCTLEPKKVARYELAKVIMCNDRFPKLSGQQPTASPTEESRYLSSTHM